MLLAGQISRTGIQYMDFVEFFNVSRDFSIYFIFLIFVGVELPLYIAVTLSVTCFPKSS